MVYHYKEFDLRDKKFLNLSRDTLKKFSVEIFLVIAIIFISLFNVITIPRNIRLFFLIFALISIILSLFKKDISSGTEVFVLVAIVFLFLAAVFTFAEITNQIPFAFSTLLINISLFVAIIFDIRYIDEFFDYSERLLVLLLLIIGFGILFISAFTLFRFVEGKVLFKAQFIREWDGWISILLIGGSVGAVIFAFQSYRTGQIHRLMGKTYTKKSKGEEKTKKIAERKFQPSKEKTTKTQKTTKPSTPKEQDRPFG